jgi:hypothetical protein
MVILGPYPHPGRVVVDAVDDVFRVVLVVLGRVVVGGTVVVVVVVGGGGRADTPTVSDTDVDTPDCAVAVTSRA